MCLQVQFTSTVRYLQFGLFVLEKELSNCPSIFRNTPKGKTQTDKFNSSNQIAETFLYHMTMFGKIFFVNMMTTRNSLVFNSPRNNLFQNIIYIYSGIFVTLNYFYKNTLIMSSQASFYIWGGNYSVLTCPRLRTRVSTEIDRSSEPQVKCPDDGSKKEMNLDRTRTYNIRTFLNIHEILLGGSTNNILKLHWFTNPV